MRTYRSQLDIIADILDAANKNAKKTQIMYKANLSFKVLQKYLKRTLAASLIRYEEEYRHFSLTNKGQIFLETYREYAKTNQNIENQVNNLLLKKKILENLCSIK